MNEQVNKDEMQEGATQENAPMEMHEQKNMSTIVAIVVVIAVILAGAAYVFSKKQGDEAREASLQESFAASEQTSNADMAALQETSSSTEVSDIDKDLNDTNIDSLLDDLNNLDKEFSQ